MKTKSVACILFFLIGAHGVQAAVLSSFEVLINHQNRVVKVPDVIHFEFADSTGASAGPTLQVRGAANKPVTAKLVIRNDSALLSTLKSSLSTFQIQVKILYRDPQKLDQYSLDECTIIKKELIFEAPDRIQTIYTFQAARVRDELRD